LQEKECAYMGDDWPDLPVLGVVGFSATVADAPEEVKRRVHWVAPSAGGRGAVRDLARMVLRAQGRLDDMLKAALRPAGENASGKPAAGLPAKTATKTASKTAAETARG
jgi:3-deoxy-D-manno-octulosonate 8-phosphate phosphatase (KDO 8-P phosphatase)